MKDPKTLKKKTHTQTHIQYECRIQQQYNERVSTSRKLIMCCQSSKVNVKLQLNIITLRCMVHKRIENKRISKWIER